MDDINQKPEAFILDRQFILTKDKTRVIGMPYMYTEGNRGAAVRLLKVWQQDQIIYLDVQELQNQKTTTLSWKLTYTGYYWLWCLADFETLTNHTQITVPS